MSNYEFWDDLGKIFNAVVAYQEKTLEFNKRFINPWIRLGNVFDKQDRNKEAVSAYQKAIEIDPDNAQNWYELGNVHFKMGHYEDAVAAFNKAIELEPGYGWSYNNLALTYVSQGKHTQAIPLYRKSIDLLTADKDKAVAWNRLGNVYRKLNEYTLAVDAFQKADDLDHENAGFRDNLDEAPEAPVVEANGAANGANAAPVSVSPIELIVADGRAEEEVTTDAEQPTSTPDVSLELAVEQQLEPEASSEAYEYQPDPALITETVAAEAELQAAASEPEAIAGEVASVPESELAALEIEPFDAAEDAPHEPLAEPALLQPEAVAEASIVEIASSTLELDSAALQSEPVVVDDADASEPVIDAVPTAPDVEPVPAEPEAVVSAEAAAPESDLELSVSQDEAIAKSEGISLEPESDSTSQLQTIAVAETVAAELEVSSAVETAAPVSELEVAAAETTSQSEGIGADPSQELTTLSEESINGDATVAQSSEPVTASESIELPQDAIAEVIAVSPETTAPVQVLETQTDALLTSAEQITHPVDAPLPVEQTISVVVQSTVETFTETLTITDTSTETTNAALMIEPAQVSLDESTHPVEQVVLQDVDPASEVAGAELAAVVEETPVVEAEYPTPVEAAIADEESVSETLAPVTKLDDAVTSVAVVEEPASEPVESTTLTTMEAASLLPIEANEPQAEEPVAQAAAEAQLESVEAGAQPDRDIADVSEHVAYEEYLKDNNQPVNLFQAPTAAETAQVEDQAAAQDPVANIDPSGELRIEMDTKNARVWNELGNVYFNTGAFDDAVIAYSKAIELDRWFAWPYSNLALTYVQKARYAEAILLYQRSIELFTSDKDKAISWNRLGNVYRRMDDYDNAICAYQRADDLDPDNTTLSLQSRFSLLGSYVLEQKPSYAS